MQRPLHTYEQNVTGDVFFEAVDLDGISVAIEERRQRVRLLECGIRGTQEALDWLWYTIIGLTRDLGVNDAPRDPGFRPTDVLFAKAVIEGSTGRRYFESCRLPPPEEVERHLSDQELRPALAAIASSAELRILESLAYKRTFRDSFRGVDSIQQATTFLLDIVERSAQRRAAVSRQRELHDDAEREQGFAATLAWLLTQTGRPMALAEALVGSMAGLVTR